MALLLNLKPTLCFTGVLLAASLVSCTAKAPDSVTASSASPTPLEMTDPSSKPKRVVYQVFTRLFGNKNTTNKPWGTLEENGVGKFSDIDDKALASIKDLGVSHVWYTGVPHHALIRDYTAIGIGNDDPDVVKGRAGSPYAVKDYYSVNPDLADDPAQRVQEFEALIERTHQHDLKVVIDIVPNHVARQYHSLGKPDGVIDFGAQDDTSVVYSHDNDFYYVVGQDFSVPVPKHDYRPLNGEAHPLSDGKFDESPAKWTGNGARVAQPASDDWYETVKVNYGIRPDGSADFPRLPETLRSATWQQHAAFWAGKEVPSSWLKFRDITQFWLAKGVDGFRYDMAEMVPVEFWSYLNSAIKQTNPNAFLLAEVYNPKEYRNYIQLGLMDYLYDKVALYDTLKLIIQGKQSTDALTAIQASMADIEHHMLHFLENHDEQRIASAAFAGDPHKAMPAMVLSATISSSPTLIYFGQEVGEPGDGNPGFGQATRTTIFDYWGVPHHQRWMNNGAFDGGQSTPAEKALRSAYRTLLHVTLSAPALRGDYAEIHSFNRKNTADYNDKVYSFVRWSSDQKLMVITNFDAVNSTSVALQLPPEIIRQWSLAPGEYPARDLLSDATFTLEVSQQGARIPLTLAPLASYVIAL